MWVNIPYMDPMGYIKPPLFLNAVLGGPGARWIGFHGSYRPNHQPSPEVPEVTAAGSLQMTQTQEVSGSLRREVIFGKYHMKIYTLENSDFEPKVTEVWKMICSFQFGWFFRFHVNFAGVYKIFRKLAGTMKGPRCFCCLHFWLDSFDVFSKWRCWWEKCGIYLGLPAIFSWKKGPNCIYTPKQKQILYQKNGRQKHWRTFLGKLIVNPRHPIIHL